MKIRACLSAILVCLALSVWAAPDQDLLPGNRPILLTHGRAVERSVLILHGFSASPWEAASLARYLYDHGFNVHVPRLSGHGASPEDFDRSLWTEWLESARQGLKVTRGLGRKVYVIGHSGGGLTACLLAVEEHSNLAGLVLAAPAFKLADWRAPYSVFAPVRWFYPRVHFDSPDEDHRLYWHQDYSSAAVAQLMHEARQARKTIPHLSQPLLLLQASQDNRVSLDANQRLFVKIPSPDKTFWVYPSSEHNVLFKSNPLQAEVQGRILQFLLSH